MNSGTFRTWALTVVVLGAAAYGPTLRVGFIWDDRFTILHDPAIRTWAPVTLAKDWTTELFSGSKFTNFYRPVVRMANRIDHTLYGLNAWGYHLTNLLLHLGNALLLLVLGLTIGLSLPAAGMVAALFAVHPANIQDMLMVTGRCGLLGLFFSLATLVFMLRPERWASAAGCVSFLFALFSKESALVVPALLAALLVYRQAPRAYYLRVAALALLILPYLVIRAQVIGPLTHDLSSRMALLFLFKAFPKVVFHYFGLTLYPWPLYSERFLPPMGAFPYFYLVFLGVIAGGLWKFRSHPFARLCGLGLVWIVITLAPPMAVMLRGSYLLDHWLYPALPGFLWPIGALISPSPLTGEDWDGGVGRRRPPTLALPHKGGGYVFLGAVVLLALSVHLQVQLRGTEEKFYAWSARYSASETMRANWATVLLEQDKFEEALPVLAELRETYPRNPIYENSWRFAREQAKRKQP